MNWIKIEDREPKEGQEVLVKGTYVIYGEKRPNCKGHVIYTKDKKQCICTDGEYINIKEWLPIPK